MYIIGNWCPRVDSGEDVEYFKSLYNATYQEIIRDYKLNHITHLTNKAISFLVFLEYDGGINQIFVLEDGDKLIVYSEDCMANKGRIFNTNGMAFFTLVKEGKEIATFCADNSPYDLTEDEFQDEGFDKPFVINKIRESLERNNVDIEVTDTNVLMVRQF